jgi:hypothetical protein
MTMKGHLRRFPWTFFLIFLFVSLVVFASAAQTASFRPEKRSDGAVVATSKYATEAGMRVLREGGNAVDAAVAVGTPWLLPIRLQGTLEAEALR